MSAYFTDASFKFFQTLSQNNNKDWFNAHKTDYDNYIRQPYLQLIADLQPTLAKISPHFHADPRNVGGSLYRIYRDARYVRDKSPLKTWQSARFYHTHARQVPAPGFYLKLEPGQSLIAAGLWLPDTTIQLRIRQFILNNPSNWQTVAHNPTIAKHFTFNTNEMLINPPRGFPKDFPFIEDLRNKKWILQRELDDATMTGNNLKQTITKNLTTLAPFVDYLCAALDLEF